MYNRVTLKALDAARIALVSKETEVFLDANFRFTGGRRYTPSGSRSCSAMVEVVQATTSNITIELIRPDGTAFDLTGVTSITLGVFKRTPVQETVSLTAGTIVGASTDGVVNFALSTTDTNFSGFAEGSVQVITPTRTVAFDTFQLVYRKNRFV